MNDKIKISYKVIGNMSGECIVFLHGFMGSGQDWDFIINHLSDQYLCITVDLPGHGKSADCQLEYYNFDNTAEQIKLILTENSIEKANLAGYSMGGRIGLFFVFKYPDIINKLVLESASPGLVSENEKIDRIKQDVLAANKILKGNFEGFLRYWYSMELFGNLSKTDKFEELIKNRLKNNREGLANSLNYMGTGKMSNFREKISGINFPVLYLAGGLDEKYKAIAHEMTELSKNVSPKIFENCGHNVHYEEQDEFLKELKDFLKENINEY